MGKIQPDMALTPAPLPAPDVKNDVPAPAPTSDRSNLWLILAGVVGVFLVALIAGGGILLMVMKRRPAPSSEEPLEADEEVIEPAAPILVACPGCKKRLKVKAALAGKKLKCPGCGKAVAVPGGEIKEAD